jgi:predicted MFS family arabinose efflux permease
MICNLAAGAAYAAFASLLIPAFVTEITGSAAEAGVIMAIIGLGAVLGPVIGTFADRYQAHRLALNLGAVGMSLAFVAYALSAGTKGIYALEAIILGISLAAVSVIGNTFIVGANLPKETEAKQLTTFNLLYPIGQLAGGALMGWAATAGWSFEDRFWLASVVIGGTALVTLLTSRVPANRLHAAMPTQSTDRPPGDQSGPTGPPIRAVLISSFGLFLVIIILSSITSNGINSQVSNIMPGVFGYSQAETATLISLAGGLNIIATLVAGKWMRRSGPATVYLGGQALRAAGATGLALIGSFASGSQLLAGIFMQVLYQGSPIGRFPQAPVGTRLAIVPAGAANGFIIGGAAIGGFLGSLLGGFVAKEIGLNAVNWMGAITGIIAVVLILLFLIPAFRNSETEVESTQSDLLSQRHLMTPHV